MPAQDHGTTDDMTGGASGRAAMREVGGGAKVDLRRTADLEAAYRAHAGELHRFAERHTRDHGAAADVVQEVFVRAWRHAERYDAELATLRVWLFTIARNVLVDHHRHRSRRPGLPTAPEDLSTAAQQAIGRDGSRPGSDGDAFSHDLVTAWFLEDALERLNPEQRTALIETHLRGRPHDEVAAACGIPIGTVRSRVFYGLRNLRRILDDMGVPL